MAMPTVVVPAFAALLLAARVGESLLVQVAEERLADPDCVHTECRISSVFQRHIDDTRHIVETWKVNVASASTTDKVAVTMAQPETPEAISLFNYIIRANMHRLGHEWALLVFYGSEEWRDKLAEALGRPDNVIWKPIKLAGERESNMTKGEANWFRLSMDFWGQIPQGLQHALIFESDSMILRGPGCVEEFLEYDYVGPPWNTSMRWGRKFAFAQGGNGGLSLRSRGTMIAAVKSDFNQKNVDYECDKYFRGCPKGRPKRRFPQNEDGEMVEILTSMAKDGRLASRTFPPREDAFRFAVEQVFHPSPCGFHNPWEYLSEEQAVHLLGTAQLS